MDQNNCCIVPYSEKCVAVWGGNVFDFKDVLKKNGGKYNKNLTDPTTKEKRQGYIFSKTTFEKNNISSLINNFDNKCDVNLGIINKNEIDNDIIEIFSAYGFTYKKSYKNCILTEYFDDDKMINQKVFNSISLYSYNKDSRTVRFGNWETFYQLMKYLLKRIKTKKKYMTDYSGLDRDCTYGITLTFPKEYELIFFDELKKKKKFSCQIKIKNIKI